MRFARLSFALLLCAVLQATIIDRIAIVVGDSIIKDSDISRDIRVVSFLNQQKANFDAVSRRTAANRLIDQALIRREIEAGEYQTPPQSAADSMMSDMQKERFHNNAVFEHALAADGLTKDELKAYLAWQLTVLRFIDQRFRPAVLVTDSDVEQYYHDHQNSYKGKTLDSVRDEVRQTLTDERINKVFDSWLNSRRKAAKIQYREESLQ
jgi:hypothetical protein